MLSGPVDPAVVTLSEALSLAPPAPTLYWGDGFAALEPRLREAPEARWLLDGAGDGGVSGRVEHGVLPEDLPPGEPTERRIVARLPRAKESVELVARVAAARLPEGGELWLAGHNREGVKSAARRLLAAGFPQVETRLVRRHCRVLVARRGPGGAPPAPTRTELERTFTVARPRPRGQAPGAGDPTPDTLTIVSYPGTFSHGRLDDGTARLLAALGGARGSQLPRFGRAVDLGAGAGVLGVWLAALRPGARVTLCDRSGVAAAAAAETARRNGLSNARVLHADVATLTGRHEPVELVVTNPPFHAGRREDRSLVGGFVEAAAALLRPRGWLWLVANRHLPYGAVIRASFPRVDVVAEDRRYRVWRARKG